MVSARIQNPRTDTSSRVRVRFYDSHGKQVGEDQVLRLAPGTTETVTAGISPDSPGRHRLQVRVEPLGEESGGQSYTLSRTLTVTAPEKAEGEAILAARPPQAGSSPDQAGLPPQRIPFEKPEQAKKGTEIAKPPGGRQPGSPPGSGGPPGFTDPTGDWGDKHKPQGVPDTTPWGRGRDKGKGGLGDGIEGVHDQEGMPKKDYGKDIPDPRQTPGQKTTDHGWGKDQYGQPMFKTRGERDEEKKV